MMMETIGDKLRGLLNNRSQMRCQIVFKSGIREEGTLSRGFGDFAVERKLWFLDYDNAQGMHSFNLDEVLDIVEL